MRRVTCTELLDEDRGTPQEVAGILDDLWRINRWLGGLSSNLRLLEGFCGRDVARPVRVLDIGAGDSQLAARLKKEMKLRGVKAEFAVLDRHLTHLSRGRPLARGLTAVIGDALSLPFADNSFDIVMCNLFFHHFSGERAQTLLRQMARVASQAVIVNDLERHILPYLFICCAPPFRRSRLSRHDAPASVRQAYTRDELADLTRSAGFADFEVCRLVPFRLGLTIWKNGAGRGRPNKA